MTPWPAEIRFILVRPREPGNIGAAARAIAGMGFESLWLVAPERFPDPEASRRAAEAADVVDGIRVVPSLEAALADCEFAVACSTRERHNRWPVFRPGQACRRLAQHAGPVALVFGPEASGLTNEDLERCQALTTIPMAASRHSLNLSHAVQIYAYEMHRANAAEATPADRERPTGDQLQQLIESWESLAAQVGLAPASDRDQRLAALLKRADLSLRDWSLLSGLARRLTYPETAPNPADHDAAE